MLLYFILGILFVSIVLPVISFFTSYLDIFIEYITYIYAYKINKIKIQMQEEAGQDDKEQDSKIPMGFHTDVIGIQIPEEEEYEQEDS